MSILGFPLTKKGFSKYKDAIGKRYQNNWEKAFSYVNKVLDREINKSIGLLTFNGILFAALSLAENKTTLINWAKVLVLFSCVPLLRVMFVVWGRPSDSSSDQKDFDATFKMVWWRSGFILISLVLSFLATLCCLGAFALPLIRSL